MVAKEANEAKESISTAKPNQLAQAKLKPNESSPKQFRSSLFDGSGRGLVSRYTMQGHEISWKPMKLRKIMGPMGVRKTYGKPMKPEIKESLHP